MTKSHYYVAPPPKLPLGDGKEPFICRTCGLPFFPKSRRGNPVYCSKECKQIGLKKYLANWYQENKEHHNNKKKELQYSRGDRVTRAEFSRQCQTRKKKRRVIKQELIYLELMTFQIKNLRHDYKIPWVRGRKNLDYSKSDYIKEKLHDLGLYKEEIEESKKYSIDYSQEYRKRKL